ncbi:IQ and AAA domain-containing 1 [Chlorella sorokiniana]|uniref:IQ and AAA domain-containing 1 n=1 Tax=Chlorella sorokiniana TaxID=3076 RepID=A0A2P6TC98_CHLSO|nr:IQ and AAA domain-containing 1 [Chlorella sorokiniana]|eukprot:PRW20260.1 IQ and AAA domain-containing 1 [Chlorella sorokiniana]
MSSRHYEELWRDGVAELVALLDAEHPEDRAAAPKSLEDWARLYIRYVQTLRKLCAAHDGVAQPQKRACLRGTLDACAGRVLELRAWLAGLNGGVDVLGEALGEQLLALSLTPDALELPVLAYFREARAEALAAHAEAAAAAVAAAEAAGGALPGEQATAGGTQNADEEADSDDEDQEAEQGPSSPSAAAGASAEAQQEQPQEQQQQPAGSESEVQHTAAAAELIPEEEARRAAAVVAIQAAGRGWLARRHVAAQRRAEMEFLGMLPAGGGRSAELAGRLAAISAERKQRQAARQAELDEGLVSIKAGVRQREGWALKERIRDKLNDWFLGSRDPETGEYADLPTADKGGSRNIIHPPPPQPSAEEAAAAAARASKAGAAAGKSSSSGKPGGGKGKAAAGEEAPRCSQAFLEGLRAAVQLYMDVWQEYEPSDPAAPLQPPELEGMPVPKGSDLLDRYDEAMVTAEVRPVVHEEVRLEADDDMRRLIQGIKDMLKSEREGRKKKGGKGGKKGSKKEGSGSKGGKGSKGDKGDAKKKAAAAPAGGKKGEAASKKGEAADGEGKPAKKKKGKDLTAGRSIESIFAELAAAGLVRSPVPTTVDQFLGGDRLLKLADIPRAEPPPPPPVKSKTGGKKANAAAAAGKAAAAAGKAAASGSGGKAGSGSKGGKGGDAAGAAAGAEGGEVKDYPEPSLAEARQAVVASCILPLGAHPALSKAQAPRTVLLYGPPGTGKSLLAAAVAHQAGASLFDLSPAATAGKYAGKAAATMVHMVFKVAKALAPSVVLLEDIDQVFISDKTRAKVLAPPGGEPPNRIKKQLLAEVADLEPVDGVLVLCTSRQPQACVKKDERALRTFVQRYIQLPLPDHGSRLTLLGAFAQREGLDASAHLSLLAQLTDGLSAGQLLAFVQQLAAHMQGGGAADCAPAEPAAAVGTLSEQQQGQGEQQAQPPLAPLVQAALELLPGFPPVKADEAQALREWTARVHSPLPPEEEPKEGKKGGKGKKK